jgi:hypothetical protein
LQLAVAAAVLSCCVTFCASCCSGSPDLFGCPETSTRGARQERSILHVQKRIAARWDARLSSCVSLGRLCSISVTFSWCCPCPRALLDQLLLLLAASRPAAADRPATTARVRQNTTSPQQQNAAARLAYVRGPARTTDRANATRKKQGREWSVHTQTKLARGSQIGVQLKNKCHCVSIVIICLC